MRIAALPLICLLLAGSSLPAQDVKVTGILEVWYTQMLDNNLRLNTPSTSYASSALPSSFNENTFSIRRTEIHFNGKISDEVTWNAVIDPNIATTALPIPLLDASITWKVAKDFSIKAGQFKQAITLDSSMGGASLYFYDRSMMSRQWGEKRDRGILATYAFGDQEGFRAKVNFGIFNGVSDISSGRTNDVNAQKDYFLKVDMKYGSDHQLAFYYRTGGTDAKDVGLQAGNFPPSPSNPSAAEILENKDKTTNMGAFYVYDTADWHADVDVMTGLLGRRYPTVFTVPPLDAKREHLDQKFLGIVISGAYKMGRHWLTARYDSLNYNQGDDWYTAANPYKHITGTDAGSDYSPKFTEMIVGYNYLFSPGKYVLGKMKIDYIHRSRNFFKPRSSVGQTGEQGGDSLVISFQIGF